MRRPESTARKALASLASAPDHHVRAAGRACAWRAAPLRRRLRREGQVGATTEHPLPLPVPRRGLSRVAAPYSFDFRIWGAEISELHLVDLRESAAHRRYWPDGLTVDIAEFIATRCFCPHCSSGFPVPLAPCSCRGARREQPAIVAAFRRVEHQAELNRIFAREESRSRKRARRRLLEAAGGSVSTKELQDLLAAQEQMCFWCAACLLEADGMPRFHADHYIPLACGGANDLANTVLACAPCNLEKNDRLPESFERRARRRRSPEDQERLTAMRRRLASWRRRRALEKKGRPDGAPFK